MKQILCLALVTLLVGLTAKAQSAADSTSQASFIDSYGNSRQQGFAGYLGANLGYAASDTNSNSDGMPSSLKILGSYVLYNSEGVFDLGYGVQNQSFSQSDAESSYISTGVMELAARYQFASRWQVGGVYNQFFNKGDSYGANQADAQFAGVQALREFSFGGNYLGRLGGRLMTTLNTSNQSVNMVMIDFQMGWSGPINSYSTTSTSY